MHTDRQHQRAINDHPAIAGIALALIIIDAWAFWWFVA